MSGGGGAFRNKKAIGMKFVERNVIVNCLTS